MRKPATKATTPAVTTAGPIKPRGQDPSEQKQQPPSAPPGESTDEVESGQGRRFGRHEGVLGIGPERYRGTRRWRWRGLCRQLGCVWHVVAEFGHDALPCVLVVGNGVLRELMPQSFHVRTRACVEDHLCIVVHGRNVEGVLEHDFAHVAAGHIGHDPQGVGGFHDVVVGTVDQQDGGNPPGGCRTSRSPTSAWSSGCVQWCAVVGSLVDSRLLDVVDRCRNSRHQVTHAR